MAWTAPKTWVFEEVPSFTSFNLHIRDNEVYLKNLFDITTGHDHAGGTDDGAPVAPGGLAASAVSASNIAGGAVGTPAIAGCAITNAEVGDNAIDDRTAGSRIGQFYRRQGGAPGNWEVTGSATYVPDTVRLQFGAHQWTGTTASSGSTTIVFPVEFGNAPLVFITGTSDDRIVVINTWAGTTGCINMKWVDTTGSGNTAMDFQWLAVGPE